MRLEQSAGYVAARFRLYQRRRVHDFYSVVRRLGHEELSRCDIMDQESRLRLG
jgi:hypothetical protein